MKYKEFEKWCRRKLEDKSFDMLEAMICLMVTTEVDQYSILNREKIWHERYEEFIVKRINPKTEGTEK